MTNRYDDEADPGFRDDPIDVPDFKPITLAVNVVKDSFAELKGVHPGELTPDGLMILTKVKKKPLLLVPVGSAVAPLPKNRLRVELPPEDADGEPRVFELFLAKPMVYAARFREDALALLEDGRPMGPNSDYRLPMVLIVLAFIPFAVLVPLGGAIGGGLGGVAFALSLLLAGQEKIPVALRALGSLGITAMAAGLYWLIAAMIMGRL